MNKELTDKDLKKFSLILAIIVSVLFGLILPFLHNYKIPYWPWIISLVVIIWPILSIRTFKIFYKIWMKIGHILGFINTRIILCLTFYLMVTPIGLFMKIFGYNPLKLGFEKEVNTYREKSEKVSPKRMEVQF